MAWSRAAACVDAVSVLIRSGLVDTVVFTAGSPAAVQVILVVTW